MSTKKSAKSKSKNEVSDNKLVDLLDEDTPIAGQKYVCLSFISPEDIINDKKMNYTNTAKFMHCLPIRRNIVASDQVLDNKNSLVLKQSENRVYACQAILKQLIDD